MAYDRTKDIGTNTAETKDGLGRKSLALTASDATDFTHYAKAVEVVAAGNLVYLPTKNADNDPVTVTDAPVGYVTSCNVRRVLSTGTTATWRAVFD